MASPDLIAFAGAIAAGDIEVVDLTHTLTPEFPDHRHAAGARPVRAVPHGRGLALRRARAGLVLEQHLDGRAYRHAFRCAGPLDLRQGSAATTPSTRSRLRTSSRRPR